MTDSLVILAAGGTGGHVFPAEALTSVLLKRQFRLALVTDSRGQSYGGALGSIATHRILAGGLAGKSPLTKVFAALELLLGTAQALRLLSKLKPGAVVGFGGYASFPTVVAALILKVPTILHEQNAVLGRANRLLALWATRIATSYALVEKVPESAKDRLTLTGMPVRHAIAELSKTPYVAPDETGPIHVVVMGGSQGARILSQVVPDAVSRLPQQIQNRLDISQQCRPEDLETVRAAYKKANIRATLSTFFTDVPHRLSQAHLVITRSGSSTVAELTALGRPAVLVPYKFATDDHQTANARALEQAGGAWCIAQDTFTAQTLFTRLAALFMPGPTLSIAAEKSRAFGRIDAAERLADLIPLVEKAPS